MEYGVYEVYQRAGFVLVTPDLFSLLGGKIKVFLGASSSFVVP